MRTRSRSLVRALLAATLVASGLLAATSPADATDSGGQQGALLIKGPGSVYTGDKAFVSLTAAPGVAASFAFEVKNTGPDPAQFNFQVSTGSDLNACAGTCQWTSVVTTGSLVVTKLAAGPHGYYTAPIAPGAVAVYALKVTPTKGTVTPGDAIGSSITLNDTGGNPLGSSYAYVNVTRSTGTGAADQFVSSTGTVATSGNGDVPGIVTVPSVAPGKTFTFTTKLKNDSVAPSVINYQLEPPWQGCSAYFPITIKQGTVNVTPQVLDGSYHTASLAHGGSVTLTATVTFLSGGAECLLNGSSGFVRYGYWYGRTTSGNDLTYSEVFFNPAAS